MSRHRIHLGDRTHSRELMDLSVRAFKVLKVSKASKSSLEEGRAQDSHLLETSLMNLRRCLVVVTKDSVVKPRPRDKTSCSTWTLTLWMLSMVPKRQ